MYNNELNYYDSDDKISEKYSELLKSITKLYREQRIETSKKHEASLRIYEFHLIKSGIAENDAVCFDKFTKMLSERAHYKDINKKFNTTKNQTPAVPQSFKQLDAKKMTIITMTQFYPYTFSNVFAFETSVRGPTEAELVKFIEPMDDDVLI